MTNSSFIHDVHNPGSAGQPFSDTKNPAGISVGAIDVTTGNIHDFSARGPLSDKRTKPDLASASNFHTGAYGQDDEGGRFPGTSAATPIAAGVAALLIQKYPKWSPAQIGKYMRTHAVKSRGTSKNALNTYGTDQVRMPLLNTGRPKVKGAALVGKTLTATPGSWSESGTSSKYQWLRNGKAIKKATKRSYKVTKNDLGKQLQVRVTVTKNTYQPEKALSAKTSKVKRAAKMTLKKRVKNTRARLTVRVKANKVSAKNVTGKAILYQGKKKIQTKKIKRGKAPFSFKLRNKKATTYKVVYQGNNRVGSVSTSIKLKP